MKLDGYVTDQDVLVSNLDELNIKIEASETVIEAEDEESEDTVIKAEVIVVSGNHDFVWQNNESALKAGSACNPS